MQILDVNLINADEVELVPIFFGKPVVILRERAVEIADRLSELAEFIREVIDPSGRLRDDSKRLWLAQLLDSIADTLRDGARNEIDDDRQVEAERVEHNAQLADARRVW